VSTLIQIFLVGIVLPGVGLVGLHGIGLAQGHDQSLRPSLVREMSGAWAQHLTGRSLQSSSKIIFIASTKEMPTKRGIQVEANIESKKERY